MLKQFLLALLAVPLIEARISRDATCGGASRNTCLGSKFGKCCSQYGWCGNTEEYCGKGCNRLFGDCNIEVSYSAGRPPRPAPTPSGSSCKAKYQSNKPAQPVKPAKPGKPHGPGEQSAPSTKPSSTNVSPNRYPTKLVWPTNANKPCPTSPSLPYLVDYPLVLPSSSWTSKYPSATSSSGYSVVVPSYSASLAASSSSQSPSAVYYANATSSYTPYPTVSSSVEAESSYSTETVSSYSVGVISSSSAEVASSSTVEAISSPTADATSSSTPSITPSATPEPKICHFEGVDVVDLEVFDGTLTSIPEACYAFCREHPECQGTIQWDDRCYRAKLNPAVEGRVLNVPGSELFYSSRDCGSEEEEVVVSSSSSVGYAAETSTASETPSSTEAY